MADWQNWSGSVRAKPNDIVRPADEAALQVTVSAARKVRVVGAGHSFMPLCETDGVLLKLDDMAGEVTVSPDRKTVWAPAGRSLKRLTAELWNQGLSLANQGDVNPQALAGAIGTGTHGTGAELGSLATIARAFRLVLADGTVVECSPTERPDLFEASRLSLGLFGVASRILIDVVPAYYLEERIYKLPLAEVVATFDDLAAAHRHAEFFIFPYADEAIVKTLHPTQEVGEPRDPSPHEDAIFQILCDAGRTAQFLIPRIQRFMTRAAGDGRRVGPAYKIFPSERSVKFEEMEYELPRAAGLPAIQEAIAWIRREKLPVAFPFEFRLTAGDDIWMSPFNQGPGASISMHQYAKMPWRNLFGEGEKIFRRHGGRPHWAKRHTLTRDEVTSLYPMAEKFREVRREVDPEGKFLNPHLADLFG
jgi:FAD-linked oxidoreductase